MAGDSLSPQARAAVKYWVPLALALLGGSGIGGTIVQISTAIRSDAGIIQRLDSQAGQIARLEAASKTQAEDLAFIRGQLTPAANLRGQIVEGASHLAQPGGPDVPGAVRALQIRP
jgi:hypothetical protein